MGGDDPRSAKRIVLARRARFVAAALASVGLAHCDACKPQPCLSAVYVPPEGGGPVPQACLSVLAHPEDAGADGDAAEASDADARDAALEVGKDAGKTGVKALDAGRARPRPCLSDEPNP